MTKLWFPLRPTNEKLQVQIKYAYIQQRKPGGRGRGRGGERGEGEEGGGEREIVLSKIFSKSHNKMEERYILHFLAKGGGHSTC